MQADIAVAKPAASTGFTTFRTAHQTWFQAFWDAGVANLQNQLKTNAQYMLANPEPGDDTATLQDIVNDPSDPKFCYIEQFTYPTT
jgi:hypothetical protein